MIAETQPLTEITQRALRLLYQELGLVDTVRFLNQFTAGLGDYTEERRAVIENQTLAEALSEVYQFQAERSAQHPESDH
ncbi:hypothetical protein GC175_12515 [bacterium]|nr:hypothetical protein [bacterium]